MEEEKKYTKTEAHYHFGIEFNNSIWSLLEKNDRTEAEDSYMINLAHASLLHWNKSEKGTEVNTQRGEYMIATAYTYAGRFEPALHHAKRCLKITQNHKSKMQDFDLAYSYASMARALALGGKKEEASKYFEMANASGEDIKDMEDKKIFKSDLASGPWFCLS